MGHKNAHKTLSELALTEGAGFELMHRGRPQRRYMGALEDMEEDGERTE